MLSFAQAAEICLVKKPFNWQDRAPRSEFWWFFLIAFLLNIALSLLALVPVLGSIVASLGGLALTWLNIVVAIRRLHDVNKSGWFLLLPGVPYIVCIISVVLAVVIADSYLFLVMCYAGVVLAICFTIYLFILMVSKGTTGPNRFGPDPLEENQWQRQQFGGGQWQGQQQGNYQWQGQQQGNGQWSNQQPMNNQWQSQQQGGSPWPNQQQGNTPWQGQPVSPEQFDPREGFSSQNNYGQSSDQDAIFSDDKRQ